MCVFCFVFKKDNGMKIISYLITEKIMSKRNVSTMLLMEWIHRDRILPELSSCSSNYLGNDICIRDLESKDKQRDEARLAHRL